MYLFLLLLMMDKYYFWQINLFLSLHLEVMEDTWDLAGLQGAFIVTVTEFDLLRVWELIPEFRNCTGREGSNVAVVAITGTARFVINSQLKYSLKNVPRLGLAKEWSLSYNKQAS